MAGAVCVRRAAGAALLLALIGAATGAIAEVSFTELLSRPRPQGDQTIAYGSERSQFGTLWLPKTPGRHPVIVLIHGGCWLAQLPGLELMDYVAGDLRARGFAVWNLEYRRLGESGGGYPGTFLDVATGIDHLRSIASRYAIDLSRTVTVGHSAGGHLALWAAARRRLQRTSPLYRADPLSIRAVVTLSGINDLQAFRDGGPGVCGEPATIDRLTAARSRNGDVYADTSPVALLPLGVRQFVVTGAIDDIVPPNFGSTYAARAMRARDNVRVVQVTGAGHFDLIDPRSPAWSQVAPLITSAVQ